MFAQVGVGFLPFLDAIADPDAGLNVVDLIEQAA